jgi:putative SOS response-associated peptidase YedK
MPVILPWELQYKWINNTLTDQEIRSLLIPYPDEDMEAYTISRLITSKTQERNIQRVIEPYSYPELRGIE